MNLGLILSLTRQGGASAQTAISDNFWSIGTGRQTSAEGQASWFVSIPLLLPADPEDEPFPSPFADPALEWAWSDVPSPAYPPVLGAGAEPLVREDAETLAPTSLNGATWHLASPGTVKGIRLSYRRPGGQWSPWSDPRKNVTLRTVPSAPGAPTLAATATTDQLSVSIPAAPASGGGTITGYVARIDGAIYAVTGNPVSPSTTGRISAITTPGTVSVEIAAVTADGVGWWSDAANGTPLRGSITVSNQTADFGVLTLAGAGGYTIVATGIASIVSVTAGWEVVSEQGEWHLRRTTDGVSSGVVSITAAADDATETTFTVTVTAIADAYSVRPDNGPTVTLQSSMAEVSAAFQAANFGEKILLRGGDYAKPGTGTITGRESDHATLGYSANRKTTAYPGKPAAPGSAGAAAQKAYWGVRSNWPSHSGTGREDYDTGPNGRGDPRVDGPIIIEPHAGETPLVWAMEFEYCSNVEVRNIQGRHRLTPGAQPANSCGVFGARQEYWNIGFVDCDAVNVTPHAERIAGRFYCGFVFTYNGPSLHTGHNTTGYALTEDGAGGFHIDNPENDTPGCYMIRCTTSGACHYPAKFGGRDFRVIDCDLRDGTDDAITGNGAPFDGMRFLWNRVEKNLIGATSGFVEWIEYSANGDVVIQFTPGSYENMWGSAVERPPYEYGGNDERFGTWNLPSELATLFPRRSGGPFFRLGLWADPATEQIQITQARYDRILHRWGWAHLSGAVSDTFAAPTPGTGWTLGATIVADNPTASLVSQPILYDYDDEAQADPAPALLAGGIYRFTATVAGGAGSIRVRGISDSHTEAWSASVAVPASGTITVNLPRTVTTCDRIEIEGTGLTGTFSALGLGNKLVLNTPDLADARTRFRLGNHTTAGRYPSAGSYYDAAEPENFEFASTTKHADLAELNGHPTRGATDVHFIGNVIGFNGIADGLNPAGQGFPRMSHGVQDILFFGNIVAANMSSLGGLSDLGWGVWSHNVNLGIPNDPSANDSVQSARTGFTITDVPGRLVVARNNIVAQYDFSGAVPGVNLIAENNYEPPVDPNDSGQAAIDWFDANFVKWLGSHETHDFAARADLYRPTAESIVPAGLGPWGADPALLDFAAKTYDPDAIRAEFRRKPTVSIVATDANASEATLDPGTFTVTRTLDADADEALTVAYTVTGTAVAGTNYVALAGSVTIPANTASATITVTPIDASAGGDLTVIATLDAGALYTLGADTVATITIEADGAAAHVYNLVTNGSSAHFTVAAPVNTTRRIQVVGLAMQGSSFNTKTIGSLGSSGPRVNITSGVFNASTIGGSNYSTGLSTPANNTTFDIVVNVDLDAPTGSQITGWKREGGVTTTISVPDAITPVDMNVSGTWALLARFDGSQVWPMAQVGFVGVGTGSPLTMADVYVGGDPANGYRAPTHLSGLLRLAAWGPLADWTGGTNKGSEGGTMTVANGASFVD